MRLTTTTDAATIIPSADTVLFVVGSIPVSDDTIHDARRQLNGWGAHTIGINRCGTHVRPNGAAR